MGFTLNHLRQIRQNLIDDDYVEALENLDVLIVRWEALHKEQKTFTKEFDYEKTKICSSNDRQ